MAEIIAEPSALSKVIPVSFKINDTDSVTTTRLATKKQFNTTDTDAWLSFTLDGIETTSGEFDLTLINVDENPSSIFHHTSIAFPGIPFHYKLDASEDLTKNEIRHAGRWIGQVIIRLANGDTTTRQFDFAIAGHLLDGKEARVILIEDYNALMATITDSKDELAQYNIDYSTLLTDINAAEESRAQAETTRQETFDALIASEAIELQVAEKYQELETTYANRLLSNEQQLADKVNRDEVTNVLTPKGASLYASLPSTGNSIGDYYYCSDGNGTNGSGNYVWNGTVWYFGGTGDEGYNIVNNDLNAFKSDISTFLEPENLLNTADSDYKAGFFIAPTTGNLSSNVTYDTTGHIKVTQGLRVSLTASDTGNVRFKQNMRFIAAYDAAGNIMSGSGSGVEITYYVVPIDVATIRVSFISRTDWTNRAIFEVALDDETTKPYVEYFDPHYKTVVVTDKTLTIENESADAKAVGDALSEINGNIIAYKNPSGVAKEATLGANVAITIPTFPQMLKTGQSFSYSAKFASFGSSDIVSVGFINPAYGNYQSWMEISVDRVKWMLSGTSAILNNLHGLTLADYLTVSVEVSPSTAQIKFTITTSGGSYSFTQVSDSTRLNAIGTLTAKSTMATTDVVLSGTCKQFKYHTWLLGDSYFGNGLDRLGGRLIEWGYASGVLFDGLGGLNSQNGYAELQKLLTYGTPKTLVWYLGMNDNATTVATYFPLVEQLCDQLGIELIFNKIPFVPSRLVENAAVNNYVLASGRRYVDSYAAVGADGSGNWYTGHLSVDGVHPSNLGAAALTSKLVADVPEILSASN